MKQQRTNNVEIHSFENIVPQYVTLKLFPDFYGAIIAFHISRAQFEWLSIYCDDKHLQPIASNGKYYLRADYAFGYTTPIFNAMLTMPKIKKGMMVWMRRAKMSIIQKEINALSK